MNLNLLGIENDLLKDLEEIKKVLNVNFIEVGENVQITKLDNSDENVIQISKGIIRYKNKNHLFRAIGLYIQLNNKEDFFLEEKAYINYIGPMIDVSRNAVYKIEKIKELMVNMAILGVNRMMLYTEDTYEIENYKYFGYLRGRYSKEELKEIDDYGDKLGIEVIPCIQTLAHLKQTLKWSYANEIKDTEDVLLVGKEKTYNFIKEMIKNIRKCFKSKKIHIGMDEAFDLGRGEFLNQNGYVDHYDIMIEHLNKVCDICKDYDFKPMIWDDMFFRIGSPNGFYYNQDTVISEEVANSIPSDLSLVYWDYYHKDKNIYRKFFDIRKVFNNNLIFAGGIWKWSGITPCYDQTFKSSNEALMVCKEENIQEVIITAWGDDGDETPIDTIIPGLILFAEHAYNYEVNTKWINERCKFITSLDLKDFFSLQELDKFEDGDKENLRFVNPSKYLLYQDLLLGAFDSHIEHIENMENHYKCLSNRYLEIANSNEKYFNMFKMYSDLANVLSIKANIGVELRKAYKNSDLEKLNYICENTLKDLKENIRTLQNSYRNLWYKDCKGQGFEVIDIRLGGVRSRVDSSIYRLKSYLNKEIDKIEELEEEILYFNEEFVKDSYQININRYKDIATQNILSW